MDKDQLLAQMDYEAKTRMWDELQAERAKRKELEARIALYAADSHFNHRDYFSPQDRQSWPFKDMVVGETESFRSDLIRKARMAAHAYAQKSGFKFQTWTDGGELYVKRVA